MTETGPMARKEIPSVEKMRVWSLLRKLLSRHLWCSLGRINQTISKKGSDNPRKNIAKGAVVSDHPLVGVLMTMASLPSFLMA